MKVYYETKPDELMHYGIPGMKWGHRRAKASTSGSGNMGSEKARYKATRKAYKAARKAYKKSFNRSYWLSENGWANLLSKKHRAKRDKSWEDTYEKLDQLDAAKNAYKTEKKNMKAAKKAAKVERKRLENEYGNLENQMTYGKNANAKKNAQLQKKMNDIEKRLNALSKKK